MTGKIYFVSAPGRIKIGFTRKPEIRLAQLRAVDMEPLQVITIADGTVYIEKKLHALVNDYRIRGEWFKDCPEVRAVIDDYVTGKLVLDNYGQEREPESPASELVRIRDVFAERQAVLQAALKECFALSSEAEKRIERGESVADLARQALFLAKNIIGPTLYGPEAARIVSSRNSA